MLCEGTAAAVAGYGHVYCSGVELAHMIVTNLHPGCGAGQEIFDDDICSRSKLLHQPLACSRLHVYSDRPCARHDAQRNTCTHMRWARSEGCAHLLFLLTDRKYELSLAPFFLTNGGPHIRVSSPVPGISTCISINAHVKPNTGFGL